MRCFFCLHERPPSVEHVFPKAVGGLLTTNRVCKPCNDWLGREVDVLLTDHTFILNERWRLGLAGNSGKVPDGVLALIGSGTMVDDPEQVVRLVRNEATGAYEPRIRHRESTTSLPDGTQLVQVAIDASGGADEVRKVIRRTRRRADLPPLSDDELERQVAVAIAGICQVENPLVNIKVTIDMEEYKRALLKVAYELACVWFGDKYLDDPTAEILRDVILGRTPLASSPLRGDFTIGVEHPPVRFWATEQDSLVAYAFPVADGGLTMTLKVFGSLSGTVLVTTRAVDYLRTEYDPDCIRFLHMDAARRTMRCESLMDEFKRMSSS